MRYRSVTVLTVAGLLALPGPTAGQNEAENSSRSTRTGVYAEPQASEGADVYAMACLSCHPPGSHTAPAFLAAWEGRALRDLFQYIREEMPKSEPGSLSSREYSLVLAYLLRMNGMPPGTDELPADPTALAKIRIEWMKGSTPPNR